MFVKLSKHSFKVLLSAIFFMATRIISIFFPLTFVWRATLANCYSLSADQMIS